MFDNRRNVRYDERMTNSYFSVPPPPLAAYVSQFWLYEGYHPPQTRERLLPTGTMDIVINLGNGTFQVSDAQNQDHFQRFSGAVLVGVYSDCFILDMTPPQTILGAIFKPGGAYPFFSLPAHELRNRHVPLEALWGSAANDLLDQLLATPTPAAKFQTFARFLLSRATRPLAPHPAIAFALDQFHNARLRQPITTVIDHTGLSPRHFIQLFRTEVGLTPKVYCRVTRFQQALQRIEAGQWINWSDLALSCGYYDQAHFIHDFHAFSGLNPTSYLARRGEHRNHVPLLE